MGTAGGVRLSDAASAEISGTFTPEMSGAHTFGMAGVGTYRLEVDGAVISEGRLRASGDDPGGAFLNPQEARAEAVLEAGRPVHVRLTVAVRDRGDMTFTAFALGHAGPGPPPGELIAEAVHAAREADVAVVVVGTSEEVESEGRDRTGLWLPGRQDELVRAVADACPRTVVVVNAGSPVELPWAEDVAAVLLGWFPGQEGGAALADVLLGHAEPGGRLPTTWPVALADCPVTEVRPHDGELRYDEGVFIGYRAWQRAGVLPRYPFGHGRGYTTWAYESATAEAGTVRVRLRNTGDRPGREVVQVYLTPEDPGPDRPDRVLAGFATVTAEPGETVTAEITLSPRAGQIWDDTAHAFRPAPDPHTLEIAHSLTDVRLTVPYA
ncbi:MAG: hypothetical protein GEV11_04585 [Streptosporangiales bacterium]|nr:hypothetical protein [Streptosporangiales bacterium]